MSEQPRQEYGEKHEKRDEKQEKENEKREKSLDEKWRRDPVSAAVWAFILIWAGLVFLADNLNLLEDSPLEGWSIFFVGAGVILLLEVVFRLVAPSYRQPVIGTIILAVIFLGIGLGELVSWTVIGPLLLIGLGAYILLSGLFRRRK
jgi:hypothetical protein